MKMVCIWAPTLTSILALGLAAGCGSSDSNGSDPGAPDETSEMTNDEQAALDSSAGTIEADSNSSTLATLPVLPITAEPASPAEAPAMVVSNTPTVFQPAGCATATASGATAILNFDHCTGPYGLVEINGQVNATFSAPATPGGVDIALSGNGLSLNSVPVDLSASLHVAWSGSTRTVSWNGNFTGKTAGGKDFEHTGEYTLALDTSTLCRTISGSGQMTIAGQSAVKSTTEDVAVCGSPKACPKSGAIEFTFPNNRTLKIDFLGGASADVTGFLGHVYHVSLKSCSAS